MAWLFFLLNLSDIWPELPTEQFIAKLIPHHLVSNWNVRWQKRPRGLADWLHTFPPFSFLFFCLVFFFFPSRGEKLCALSSRSGVQPCRTSGVSPLYTSIAADEVFFFPPRLRRGEETTRKLRYNETLQQQQQQNKKKERKIMQERKGNKDVFWRGRARRGRRAREDRWDILFRLTSCWKKLPLFQSGLHLFFFPPSRWRGKKNKKTKTNKQTKNFRSVNSGTGVLLWPPAEPPALFEAARRHVGAPRPADARRSGDRRSKDCYRTKVRRLGGFARVLSCIELRWKKTTPLAQAWRYPLQR